MVDFPLNLSNRKGYCAWLDGSLWLSLDRFERFWPDAGLTFSNGEAVKSAIRETLRARYERDAANRARWAADPDAEDDMDDYSEQAQAEACFRTINETAGSEDAERFAAWLAGPVLAEIKGAAWRRAWGAVLYHLWKEAPDTIASRHGISADTVRRIGLISARYMSESDAMGQRVEAADQEPLEGWDAIAYADYRQEDLERSPLDGVRLYMRYIIFDRAWAEIRRCVPRDEIDGLIRWGRAYYGEHQSDHEEQLVLPDDVRSAW